MKNKEPLHTCKMGRAFQDVDGCRLRIPHLHSTVTFSSIADALFASLVVKYTESLGPAALDLFDDILQLHRREDFSASQLNIQKTLDIIEHIASERRMNAERRGTQVPQNQMVPKLVVELVTDHLEEEMRMVCEPLCPCGNGGRNSPQSTLRNLSLVHPTWTRIAQHRLRRRARFECPLDLFPALMNPQLGPWTHELAFEDDENGYEHKDVRLAVTILDRCPNTRRLVLREGGERLFLYEDFVMRMKSLRCLRQLAFDYMFDVDTWSFCSMLPDLQCLESLRLYDWDSSSEFTVGEIPQYLRTLKPSSTLQSLTLSGIPMIDVDPLIWLLEPNESYMPKYLKTDVDVAERILDRSTFIVSSITGLSLDVIGADGDMITSIVNHFTSVRTLTLCTDSTMPSTTNLVLSGSIRSFRLHMHIPSEEGIGVCLYCVNNAPQTLRKLLITYNDSKTSGERHLIACDDVARACEEKNVEFDLRYTPHFPSIFDVYQ